VFSFCGFITVRYRQRLWTGLNWRWNAYRRPTNQDQERVLIVGAGEAGEIFARRILYSPAGAKRHELIGFIDDDPAKHRMRLHDLPIFGGYTFIPEIVAKYEIDLIVIAIYNISGPNFRNILDVCEKTPARIKIIPDPMEFLELQSDAPPIRDVSSEDLLGRKIVEIDATACSKLLEGCRVLVTGAAGSIGSELCEQILAFNPQQLILLDNNESGLYEIHNHLKRVLAGQTIKARMTSADRLIPIVCSITNRSKMNFVFSKYRPEIVFHAAAYKHVPMMEDQPDEALWVNVYGTKNLVQLSREYEVERFVFVSTDKAVQPVCVMGATKWLAELMIMNPDAWSRREREAGAEERRKQQRTGPRNSLAESNLQGTLYTAVRFGNVLASRGSVVPAFEQQIRAGGPVMVTHPEMTRYFLSIKEAVRLIIQAATFTQGCDIFMLHMGERIKIDDLARRLIRLRGARPDIDIPIVYTGIRPGEKMHEELVAPSESKLETQHPRIFRIRKNHMPPAELLAAEIDELHKLAKDHENADVAERLQKFVSLHEGQQPGGHTIMFRGKISELMTNARDAESRENWDLALDYYNEALRLSEGIQNRSADLLCKMAHMHLKKWNIGEATELLNKSKDLSRRNGYIPGLLQSSILLGKTAELAGDFALAIKHYRSAMRMEALYKTDENRATILASIGRVLEKQGKTHKAVLYLKKAVDCMKEDPVSSEKAEAIYRLGSCAAQLSWPQRAEKYLYQALIFSRQLQDKNLQAEIYIQLSRLSLMRKQRLKARELAEQALEILLAGSSKVKLAEAYLILGSILREELKLTLAEEHLQKCLNLCVETGQVMLTGDVYVALAMLYIDQEQITKALQHLSLAQGHYSRVAKPAEVAQTRAKMEELEKLFVRVCREMASFSGRGWDEDHGLRVALHCLELAEWLGLTADQKKALVSAALLHDIGTSKICEDILMKRGGLTDEELAEIKKHVLHSATMIEDIQFPWPEVLAYVKYHHERYDGEGYPLGLRKDEIHLGARILALADFYVALTSDRSHRKAFPVQEALELVRQESGRMFDPKVVEVFLHPRFVDMLLSMTGNVEDRLDSSPLWARLQNGSGTSTSLKLKNAISSGSRPDERDGTFGL
jgi:FlaA1/EpsC-like NDP-sugar epimerase/HD-GYP domain-containing protein (c-di-GMP phosphodiesterase class II)